MKRAGLIYLMLCVLLLWAPATAVEKKTPPPSPAPWSFGFSGGLNSAGMYGTGIQNIEDKYEVASRQSGNGGVYLSYAVLPWLPLELGVEIMGKGYQYSDNEHIDDMSVDYQIISKNEFWEFPLCARPTVIIGRTRLSFIGGISYAAMYGAERVVKAHLSQYNQDTTIEIYNRDYFTQGVPIPIDTFGNDQSIPYKELYRPYDFSFVLGCGFERRFGTREHFTFDGDLVPASTSNSSFFIDLRCYIGVLDNIRITAEGQRQLDEAYGKLFKFFADNNIDPAAVGYGPQDVPKRDPVYKFSTLSVRAGFRFYF